MEIETMDATEAADVYENYNIEPSIAIEDHNMC